MLLCSHAGELLLVEKNNHTRGIISLSMALHILISRILCYDFENVPACHSITLSKNMLTHLVYRCVSIATFNVHQL